MKIPRAGVSMLAAVAAACLVLSWSEMAQAQVKLQYKFPEGQKLTYKSTEKIRQVLTLMGMEIETEDDKTVVTSITVGKRRLDSTRPVEQKVESLRDELSLPGGLNVTYDSKEPDAKIETPGLAFLSEVFKLAGEINYTLVLDDQNKVKAIEGTEKLVEKADKLSPKAKETIRGSLDPDKLKRNFEQSHQNLPDVLARPGEPWERTLIRDVGSGQTITFRKKYEYVGTDKKGDKTLDKITAKVLEVKFTQDPESKSPLKVLKSDLKVDSSDETILFDHEEGCVVSARSKTRLKGSMTFSGGGMELPGAIDLTLQNDTDLQQPAAKK